MEHMHSTAVPFVQGDAEGNDTGCKMQDAECGAVIVDAFHGLAVITVLFLSSMRNGDIYKIFFIFHGKC
jgi:hypothetical protein